MARYFGLAGDEPRVMAEAQVARALRGLPDEWVIFHHVTWQSFRRGREGDGEADFVLVHPRHGLLVLEVKGGKKIEIIEGRWFSTDRYGATFPIKNPYEQATDSKHALLKYFEDKGMEKFFRMGHAVCFPGLDEIPELGLYGTRAVTWVEGDLSHIVVALERTRSHWELSASLTGEDISQLINILAPTVSVRRSYSAHSADAEAQILNLTAEQIEAFSGLHANRGGLVVGGAGTGKTVLAVARAQQLAKEGFNTLLVCFNEILGSDLAERLSATKRLEPCTFHSLCLETARKARLSIPSPISASWWEGSAADLLVEAAAAISCEYDAIVVDEAQDFAPAWIDALKCLIAQRQDAPMYLFADPRQDLWDRKWDAGLETGYVFQLNLNMRNTKPIAEKVAAAIKSKQRIRNLPGPAPLWRDIPDHKKCDREVISAIERLLDEGFGPANIVILCDSAKRVARLREYTVGDYSLGAWGGRGIPVETIARFKGMEAQAIILILEEEQANQLVTRAYVGMSRARSLLFVVGSQRLHKSLSWN